jgi:2-keto-4-pentenoate hydratase
MQSHGIFIGPLLRSCQLLLLLLLVFALPPESLASESPSETFNVTQWQQAYSDQNAILLNRLEGRTPAGFKAGLTSAAAQQKFKSDRAVFGVLLAGSQLAGLKPIQMSHFGRGMVELEVGFRLSRAVTTPIADIVTLKSLVAVIAPAFELPDLALLTTPSDGVLGIVRANVAAHSFVVGEAIVFGESLGKPGADIDAMAVKLHRDGDLVLSASSGDILGGQWQNLLALINDRVAEGWVIQPDQWLLTGAIGQMLPLQAGRYEAKIDGLSDLAINVLP